MEIIEKQYYCLLERKEVPDDLIIDLKDFYWNLKSILDYAWKHIGEDWNFPMRNSEKDLMNSKKYNNKSNLEKVKNFQPYNNTIAKTLNSINNWYKHMCLIPQKRMEETRVTVSWQWWGSVSWGSWVTFWSWVSIMWVPVDPSTQRPIANNIVTTKEEKWISFIFDTNTIEGLDKNINVLWFSKDALKEIKIIINILWIEE